MCVGFWVVAFCREHVFKGWRLPMGSDYPTVRKRTSDKGLGDSAESMITRVEFLASGSDDSTLSRWTVGLMDRSNDQKPWLRIQLWLLVRKIRRMVWRPLDKLVGQMTSAIGLKVSSYRGEHSGSDDPTPLVRHHRIIRRLCRKRHNG